MKLRIYILILFIKLMFSYYEIICKEVTELCLRNLQENFGWNYSIKLNGLDKNTKALNRKPWTLLTYVVAGDDLYNPWFLINQKQMESVGSNKDVNILIYLNKPTSKGKKYSEKIIVNKGSSTVINRTWNQDGGAENTLIDAIKWASNDFPSDNILLVLWNHGDGWRNKKGICFDENSGENITDLKLKRALEISCKKYRNGKPIDILAMDACLMNTIEIISAVHPYARFLVASQQTIPAKGYEYSSILNYLSNSNIDVREFAIKMVEEFDQYYKQINCSYALSALDMNFIDSAVLAIKKAIEINYSLLRSNNVSLKNAFIESAKLAPHFEDYDYIDLVCFIFNLRNKSNSIIFATPQHKKMFEDSLNLIIHYISKCIIANLHSKDLNRCTGISIYFPCKMDESYNSTEWALKTKWSKIITMCI